MIQWFVRFPEFAEFTEFLFHLVRTQMEQFANAKDANTHNI